jgi:hypothetical protein
MSRPLSLHLRATAILVALCLLGSWSALPLLVAAREHAGQPYAGGLPSLIGLAAVQTVVTFGLAAFLGLRAAAATGLPGAPLILRAAGGPPAPRIMRFLIAAAGLGVAAGLIVVAADLLFFQNGHASASMPRIDATFGLRLLTGFLYGGINEEVLMRLFLVSGLVYLLSRIIAKDDTLPPWLTWTAIVIAAILFGVSHLPFTGLLTALTPLIVVRAIVLNGIVGLLCGRLYVLFGIEAAMVAHAAAHLPLQIATAAFRP